MAFVAPLWLIGLAPWALLAAWLLWGRRRREDVPFLPLWAGTLSDATRTTRRFCAPPIALAAALLAALLAILAAANPVARGAGGRRVTVIVDRGLTMSALRGGVTLFALAAEGAKPVIAGAQSVEVVDAFSGESHTYTGTQWADAARAMPRTAVNLRPRLEAVVRDVLRRTDTPVVLLTDATIRIRDDRLVQITAGEPPADVAITRLAARDTPTAQVMVIVRNRSATRSATLAVSSAGHAVTRQLNLSAEGAEQNYFVDVPSLGEEVEARLTVTHDVAANNAAWLIRHGQTPRVEARPAVPDPVRRMVEVYTRTKPTSPDAPVIAVVTNAADLGTGDAGAIIATTGNRAATGELRIASGPLTAVVDWDAATQDVAVAPPPSTPGWEPIVTRGADVLVARRESPARQVWVGFDQTRWATSPDFVVFWANAFDWLAADAATRWEFVPVRKLPDEWKPRQPPPAGVEANAWPGVYQTDDGRTLAMNADPDPNEAPTTTPAPSTPRVTATTIGTPRSGAFLLAAIACTLVAALTWHRPAPRPPLTPSPAFSPESATAPAPSTSQRG